MKKLLSNDYIFSVLTKMLMVVIGFVYSILIARFLGPGIKGIHATIYSIISIGSLIVNMCCYQAYPFFRKKYGYENYYNKFMSFLVTYHLFLILISSIIFVSLPLNDQVVRYSILLVPINAFATSLGYVCLIEHSKSRNIALLLADVIDILMLLFLMMFFKPDNKLVLVIMLVPLIIKILYFIYKERFCYKLTWLKLDFFKELISFSFFPMVSMLLTMLNYKIDILMLKENSIISLSQIGIYSIGVSLSDKAVYIPDAVKEILLSKLAKGKGEKEVALVMRFCFPISLATAFVLAILGNPVINFLYGKDYSGAFIVSLICVLGTSAMVFFKMISQYNNVNGKQLLNVLLLLVSVMLNVVLNLLLIPVMNINGAAVASLISYCFCALIFIVYFKNISGLKILDFLFLKKSDILKIKGILKPVKKEISSLPIEEKNLILSQDSVKSEKSTNISPEDAIDTTILDKVLIPEEIYTDRESLSNAIRNNNSYIRNIDFNYNYNFNIVDLILEEIKIYNYKFNNEDYLRNGKYPTILSNNHSFMKYVIDKDFNNIFYIDSINMDKNEVNGIINYTFKKVYFLKEKDSNIKFNLDKFKNSDIVNNNYFIECLKYIK